MYKFKDIATHFLCELYERIERVLLFFFYQVGDSLAGL